MQEIRESAEMYLETILILSQKKDKVRSVDIVNELKYKKSSVSVAMKHLRENKLIVVNSEGHIELTTAGKTIAETIFERHNFFSTWLIKLGVDEYIALDDACRIEHVISPESFQAIREYVKNTNIKQVK